VNLLRVRRPQSSQSLHKSLLTSAIALIVLTGIGCAMATKKFTDVTIGQWESRALVRDAKSNKSFIIYMTFIAENKGRLRLDVTSSVGSQISSMLVEKEQVTLLLLRDKKFYKGPASSPRLFSALNLPLDPRIFLNILFDQPVEQKGWSCAKDAEGIVTECKNAGQNIRYTIADRSGAKRTVTVTHPRGSAQVNFTKFNSGPFDLDKIFALPTPKSFGAI
jgi:hypothetical protein